MSNLLFTKVSKEAATGIEEPKKKLRELVSQHGKAKIEKIVTANNLNEVYMYLCNCSYLSTTSSTPLILSLLRAQQSPMTNAEETAQKKQLKLVDYLSKINNALKEGKIKADKAAELVRNLNKKLGLNRLMTNLRRYGFSHIFQELLKVVNKFERLYCEYAFPSLLLEKKDRPEEALYKLLESAEVKKYDINMRLLGHSLLMVAAHYTDEKMVELLLKLDAKINFQQQAGYNALFLSIDHAIQEKQPHIQGDSAKIAKLLIDAGINLNAKEKLFGHTALSVAKAHKNEAITKLLSEANSNKKQ